MNAGRDTDTDSGTRPGAVTDTTSNGSSRGTGTGTGTGAGMERDERRLVVAGWVFAAGSAIHVVDHLRRGQGSVTEELYWAGNLALVVQVVVVTLVVTRHRLAPLAAVAGGFPLALGFFVAHWLPSWGVLSDPAWEVESWTAFTYLASTAEILGALAVGVAGLMVIRRRGLDSFGSGDRGGPDADLAPAPSVTAPSVTASSATADRT